MVKIRIKLTVFLLFFGIAFNQSAFCKTLTSEEATLKYNSSLQKIFEIKNKIEDIHPFLKETFPIAIVEENYFFVFDTDSSRKKYVLVKEAPTNLLKATLQFFMNLCIVINGKIVNKNSNRSWE
jgi:hypothetical protein